MALLFLIYIQFLQIQHLDQVQLYMKQLLLQVILGNCFFYLIIFRFFIKLNKIYNPNNPYIAIKPTYVVEDVESIAHAVVTTNNTNVNIYFLSLNLFFKLKNVPITNGKKHTRLTANVDGSNAIEHILFMLLLICSNPCAA